MRASLYPTIPRLRFRGGRRARGRGYLVRVLEVAADRRPLARRVTRSFPRRRSATYWAVASPVIVGFVASTTSRNSSPARSTRASNSANADARDRSVDRRERAAEHVIEAPILDRALERDDVGRRLDIAGTSFFLPEGGGQPLLWQHMFWFFGHPEVYILVLPAMGVTSDILSTFSRKPIFGYHAMAFSMIAIAFLSWIVWGHHMFVSGMNPLLGTAFMMTTMVIAVPSAIKVFNWLGTLWGGTIRFTSPMLFALGFVSNFVIGGLSGVFMASTPVDIYIHDTYYIVAHFHYVVAGIVFALFAAVYYWFPKMFGRTMNEPLAKIHFILTYIFFNGAFFPMHFLGVAGHMRRIYNPTQYEFLQPMQHWNVFITISALLLGASQFFFLFNFVWSLIAGKKADRNPWQANTLEWSAPTPPPHGNFEVQPVVYRGPYEYSSPEVKEDWLPQDRNLGTTAAARAH